MLKSPYDQLNDRAWLVTNYVDKRRSAANIAAEVKCDKTTVYRALDKHGIPRRRGKVSKHPLLENREWLAERLACHTIVEISEIAGASTGAVTYFARKHGLTTGGRSEAIKAGLKLRYPEGRTGAQAANWRGGRTRHKAGYIEVYAPDHPRAHRNKIFEHILVMEEKLGRYLEPGEIVHHINHVKDDNRPENLMVTRRGAHVTEHFAEGKRTAEAELEAERLKLENERLRAIVARSQHP